MLKETGYEILHIFFLKKVLRVALYLHKAQNTILERPPLNRLIELASISLHQSVGLEEFGVIAKE